MGLSIIFQALTNKRQRMKAVVSVCLCELSPVYSFVVVVGVEELDLLISLLAGEVTGDGRMHE